MITDSNNQEGLGIAKGAESAELSPAAGNSSPTTRDARLATPAANSPYGAIRMTKQRRMIMEEFKADNYHPSADEIYANVRERLPNISLGTVYRNLELLSQAGLIRKLDVGGRQKQYDGGLHKHYHVRCTSCGQTSDVPAQAIGDLDKIVCGAGGFEITGHELAFEGICPACKTPSSDTN